MSGESLLLTPNIYKYSDFNKIDEDFGQFTALLLNDNNITYCTDHFGAGHPDLLPQNIYMQIESEEKSSRELSILYSQLSSIWDNYS